MFKTLITRNAKRSFKDYLIYVVTMTIISTLMVSFHGMIFSKDLRSLFSEMSVFTVLIATASFFIIGIVIWLVKYMVNFMMEKRSKEFGTYLLLGMKKKQIIRLFRRENYLLGLISAILGILPGFLFQLLFVNIFYAVLEADYRISPDFNGYAILLSFGVLAIAYFFALRTIKQKMKKMTIRDFILLDQQNEKIIHERNSRKGTFLFLSVIYILFFNYLILTSSLTLYTGIICSLILVLSIYLLYYGLSAFFIRFIQRKRPIIYKNETIFILRQLSSKIKTMRFTMGTLTVLFTGALLSWMVVMMFADFQRTQVKQDLPFDVALFSPNVNDSFNEQLTTIASEAKVKESFQYSIYQNKTTVINDYLYDHVDSTYKGKKIKKRWTDSTYFGYDTYMRLSDYNHLRKMLGYDQASLKKGQYILHGKERLAKQWKNIGKELKLSAADQTLKLRKINMESFAQGGLNGADYLIVVPDETTKQLKPYFRAMVADLATTGSMDLQEKLEKQDQSYVTNDKLGDLYTMAYGHGSNQIVTTSGSVMVKDYLVKQASFVVVSVCFMMAYLGIVFLCAALTILAVQQLSDANKHRIRYQILQQLGLSKREMEKVVLKQLGLYYLCPLSVSVILSFSIGLFAGERFVYYTGVPASPVKFYGIALLVFSVIYLAYFLVTYIGFTRNLEKG